MTALTDTRMQPYDDVLVALARAWLDESKTEGLQSLLARVDDWSALYDRARSHGLAPLLAYTMERLETDSEKQREALHELRRRDCLTSLRLESECRKVLRALREAGVSPIVVKGPSLAHSLYPEPSLRPFGDIDLLIEEADWPAVRRALLEIGAVPEGRDDDELPPRLSSQDMLDHWYSFAFPSGFRVECSFDPLELGVRMRDLEGLHRRAVPLAGWGNARRLAPEDELLVLAVHLNRHGFARLIWFLDIALLVRDNSDLDWDLVGELARAEGVSVSVHHTLELVSRVLDVPLDAGIAATRPGPLASRVWRRFWACSERSPFDGDRDGPLVFRKGRGRLGAGEYVRLTAANLLMTGRFWDKSAFALLKAFPPQAFLRERYAAEGEDATYARLWWRRFRSQAEGGERFPATPPADEGDSGHEHKRPSFNRAIVWNATAKFATRGMQFLVTIVLARLLVPRDFGLANMANVVTGMIVIFAEFGFAYAVMQKLDLSEEDISTAWTVSLGIGSVLTAGLFLCAPLVAMLFRNDSLVGPLRVAAFGMLVVSFAFTPMALLTRRLDFRSIALAEFSGNAAYGVVAIVIAFLGGDVWSLVLGSLAMFVVRSTLFTVKAGQRFRPAIHRSSLAALLPFGSRVLVSNGFEFVRSNMDYFIVGRTLGPAVLGLYEIAFRLTDFPRTRLGSIVSEVAFPAMSSVQNHADKIRRAYGKSVFLSSLLSVPVLLGLAVLAREFVLGVYGAKWLAAVAPLQVLLIASIMLVPSQSAVNVLLATGRASLSLWMSVLYAGVVTAFVAAGVSFGIVGVAWGVTTATTVYVAALGWLVRRHVGISLGLTMSSMAAPTLGSVLVAAAVVAYRAALPFPDATPWQLPWLAGAVAIAAAVYLPVSLPALKRWNAEHVTVDDGEYSFSGNRPKAADQAFAEKAVNQG